MEEVDISKSEETRASAQKLLSPKSFKMIYLAEIAPPRLAEKMIVLRPEYNLVATGMLMTASYMKHQKNKQLKEEGSE